LLPLRMQPIVSIITITYNAEKFLEKTILSVLAQTYPYIEYIIIDGKSKDGTLDIVKKYETHIATWISEPDKGIYDAMNKGLERATGEYVWFMNAGDEIFSPDTLAHIMSLPTADVYYGETEFRDLVGKYLGLRSEVTPLRLPARLTWKSLQMGLMVCHQAILVRKNIAPQYDLAHHYSADTDWVIRALKQAQSITNVQATVAVYLQGGFSRRNLRKSLLDRFAIMRKHYGLLHTLGSHVRIVWRSFWFLVKTRKRY
jgi:glycosyltransferase involved in cell wall biosynthesis